MGQTELLRRLPLGQAAEVDRLQYIPVSGRQLLQGAFHLVVDNALQGHLVRPLVGAAHIGGEREGFTAGTGSQGVDGFVTAHRDKPSLKRAATGIPKLRRLPKGGKYILEHLFGQGPFLAQPEHKRVKQPGIAVVDGGQGFFVPLPDAFHEFGVAEPVDRRSPHADRSR